MTNWGKKLNVTFSWFQLFKYTVYSLLIFNVFLFFNKELKAAAHRFSDGIIWLDMIDAFSSTLDTGAWVVLILLFELETFILSDEQLKGRVKWLLRILRSFSYIVICYAFYGYLAKYGWVMNFVTIDSNNLCQFTGQSWMVEADNYKTITQDNCHQLSTTSNFLKKADKNIFTDFAQWAAAYRMALTDIFNSGAWILVVIILEIDIWLQLKNQLTGKIYLVSKIIKSILYTVLLGAAIYWGIVGNFLEFWDAFLWIIAFVFIENNLFQWQAETSIPRSIL